MTLIAGRGQAALSTMQPALPRLAVGQRIEATVLGPTRKGVSVMIGQEKLQLDAPSRLANARTLTLEGAPSSSAAGQQVQVVAADGEALARPISADLRSRPKPISPEASTVLEKGLIRVTAQPLAADGKAKGPEVALHLNAGPANPDGKATAGRSPILSPVGLASTTDVEAPLPRGPAQQIEAGPVQRGQAEIRQAPDGVERVRDRGSGPWPSQPASVDGRTSKRDGAPHLQTSPSAPGTPSPQAFGSVKTMPGEAPLIGMPSGGHQRAASTMSTDGNAPPSIKQIATSAVSAYRNEAELRAVRDPNIALDTPRSIDRRLDASDNRPMSAVVAGRTETGKVVLNMAGQHYRIEQPIDLPTGTPLQVIPASSMLAQGAPGNGTDFQNAGLHLARLVEILDDIDRAGRQAAEADQPSKLRQLPAPDRHLASKFLGLLNAGRGMSSPDGQAQSSGQVSLAMARRDQIETLVRELGTMASEPLGEGWKGMTLPLGLDPAQAVSFFFREQGFDPEDESAEGDADHSETQRAVFDIAFSRLGRCQIDALCQEGRFDLLIRSEHLFTEENRREITVLFSSACEIAGVTGEIGFKVGGFFEPVRSPAAGRDLRT